ncbi:MAG: c-type cytochrome [Chromatiales bacterium]|nr:c-type cytochrome [Chromatiales bacterium]
MRRSAQKQAEHLEQGRAVYNNHCYFCHGYDGDSRTLASRYLDPPPRDFTAIASSSISRERMIAAVSAGRPDTAMKSFSAVLNPEQIEAVVDFVRSSFIESKKANTAYHIAANGWPDHERYRDAYPFALGEIALDTRDENLSVAERRGKRLFMSACITCHDRAHLEDDRTLWAPRAVSYPRAGYMHREGGRLDSETGATPYARHDHAPALADANARVRRGERIFQDNCAFCHGADGSGGNWIGSFLQPQPRDLTNVDAMKKMDSVRLRAAIASGVEGSAMPAWRTVLADDEIDAVAAYVEQVFMSRASASPSL